MNRICLVLIFLWSTGLFATEYYVSTKGNDSNNGLSQDLAWRTIAYAAQRAQPGDVVWIEAGDYGKEQVVINKQGTKQNPISFIGYKSSKGDINSLYFKYEPLKELDPQEMPLLDGQDRANGLKAITLNRSSYIIVKNIQIRNYRWGIHGGSTNNSILERIVARSFGDINTTSASGYGAQFDNGGHNTIKESIFINATGVNLRMEGDFNVIDNVKSYADDNSTKEISATDYYIHINGGNNNIIRNSYVERVGDLDHSGHGFGLKYDCQNNLIENCVSVNVKGAIELRHSGVKNNIVRNVLVKGPLGTITLRDGASKNIVENCLVENTNEGVRFYDQTEDGQGGIIASDNIIRNTIFKNIGTLIVSGRSSKVTQIGLASGNKLVNCTVDGAEFMFNAQLPMDNTNDLLNCVFTNVKNYTSKSSKYPIEWVFTNNNFFQNGFSNPAGKSSTGYDPAFQDAAKGNYRLKSNSKLIDAGIKTDDATEDHDGNNRPSGSSHDIGAFEFQDNTSGSINLDLGPDTDICPGEKIILSAGEADSYLWSNGSTDKSIEIQPTETTLYSVTVFSGGNTASDEIVIGVNHVNGDAGDDVRISEGESITLTATGGDQYEWSTGENAESIQVNPLKTTIFSVKIRKNGCEVTDTVKVEVIPKQPGLPLVVADAGEDQTICMGDVITLTGNGGDSYVWNTGENTKSIQVSPSRTTTYELQVETGGQRDVDKVTITVESCSADEGSEEEEPVDDLVESDPQVQSDGLVEQMTVYPNPASGGVINVNISNMEEDVNLDLINMNGSIIYSDMLNIEQSSAFKQLDLRSIEKGVYFVRVYNSNQNLVKKVIMI